MPSQHSVELVKFYFGLGLAYDEILSMLAGNHGYIISRTTLKRILRKCSLGRRKHHTELLEATLFLLKEQLSGTHHGYRWMHLKCHQAGINIPRDKVLMLQNILDPQGVSKRSRRRLKRRTYHSKGPNFVWHLDSYDKLKPFGIAINGCIDGFSRKVIWLEAASTNSDPRVIAGYYIQAVKGLRGCPQRVRADMGTENRHVEQMQVFLRQDHQDNFAGNRSFLYGKSTHNQRIEWFWGLLRKEMCNFWIELFRSFAGDELSLFCGDLLDRSLIQFCFMDLIQVHINYIDPCSFQPCTHF